jgi:hypothetical protein
MRVMLVGFQEAAFRGAMTYRGQRIPELCGDARCTSWGLALFDAGIACCLTNRASAAGAKPAGAPCARSFYGTRQAHKRNSSLLGCARQLQALVRPQQPALVSVAQRPGLSLPPGRTR